MQLTSGPQVTLESSDILVYEVLSTHVGRLIEKRTFQEPVREDGHTPQDQGLHGGTSMSLLCLGVLR